MGADQISLCTLYLPVHYSKEQWLHRGHCAKTLFEFPSACVYDQSTRLQCPLSTSLFARYQRNVTGFAEVLSDIPPKRLPGLIKNNLCPELLTLIIRCVSEEMGPIADTRVAYLSSLAGVPRLAQTLMFLDDMEVKELTSVFRSLLGAAEVKEAVVELAQKFDIEL
eukprot:m.607945 g.607945  ORF g.607945 m.607945 type:complete len:166 (-) comp22482_c0_seq12:858-1355(-)